MNRVYLINTNLTEETNKNLNNNLSEKDQQAMLDLDLKLSVDLVNENNFITSVVICNQINLEKMKEFFKNNNVDVDIQDATDLFVNENKDVEDLIEEDIVEKMCKDVESEK
jgi:hypothetical protein